MVTMNNKGLIAFTEAFISYNELQFLDWPNTVAHSLADLTHITYGLVMLFQRNNRVTTITIGYNQFPQGFEC